MGWGLSGLLSDPPRIRHAMKLYLTVIGLAMTIISLINIAFTAASWYYIIIAVIWCTALQFAIDGTIAIVINKLPNQWFSVDNPLYKVGKKERNIYKFLRVRDWKDKVWELGFLGGFSKKSLKEPSNPQYIETFIVESNKGVLTHKLAYAAGFLAMFTLQGITAYTIALPVAIVNFSLSLLPTIVLRYNTPLLHSVLSRLRRKQESLTHQ